MISMVRRMTCLRRSIARPSCAAGLVEHGEQRVERATRAAGEQGLLAVGVIVDARLGDAGGLGDLVERRAVVAAAQEDLHRDVNDRVEVVGLAFFCGWTAHRFHVSSQIWFNLASSGAPIVTLSTVRRSMNRRAGTAQEIDPMKYAIAIRNMGPQSTRETIRACARIAEQLGFDALFVSDHLCIPPDETEGSGGRYLDVLATLAFLAGATERIRLGVSVLVLPYRPAVLTAKQVATIQELSGERMILGVGVGWMKREFEALGVDKRLRGRMSNETLRVLRHLFTTQARRPMTATW